MASPASPIGYVKHQVATLKVNSQGTWNLLELAEPQERPLPHGQHERGYGDPAVHPQREDYWGNVNPIGLRSMYDEAKRFSEACTMAYHRERGVDTRIVRIFNTYGPRMDPYDGRVVISFIRQAAEQRADHRLRRGEADAEPVLRVGPRPRDQHDDGERLHRADQPRQPRGDDDPADRQGSDRPGPRHAARSCTSRCRRTTRGSAAPTSPGPGRSSAGRRSSRARKAWRGWSSTTARNSATAPERRRRRRDIIVKTTRRRPGILPGRRRFHGPPPTRSPLRSCPTCRWIPPSCSARSRLRVGRAAELRSRPRKLRTGCRVGAAGTTVEAGVRREPRVCL